ncbi:MAG: hypothetical protein JEZ09_06035 [Salinivirgaceae bacterium]|nr:hypothetical protein [Salinivirgaceae bacterium]
MIIMKRYFVLFGCFVLLATSCKNDKKGTVNVEKALEVELDTTSKVIKFENSLFSIPSPYQLSILIKEIGANYNSELLNPSDNFKQYTSLFKKSINLGIYGADLAYLNIYEQSPSAITYFSVIKILAQDLGLSAAFSPKIFSRIENNIDNQDSLLFIMSNTYRDVDFFLKENQRQREGTLVLAGGWIEAMHILTKLAIETKSEQLIQRVGENKQPLENLIKILQPYYNESEDIEKLIEDLIDLSYEFDAVETAYKYVEPTTEPENKITRVHSETKIVITESVLKVIDSKIEEIRNLLIK